jgi:hypothetical protein
MRFNRQHNDVNRAGGSTHCFALGNTDYRVARIYQAVMLRNSLQ